MPPEVRPFLVWIAGLCAVMAVVWALRARTRGWTAAPMACAFVVFGVLALVLRAQGPQWLVIALCIALMLLLLLDAVVRTARRGQA